MNIEESIEILKELKKNEWGELDNCSAYAIEAIETLLTAYEKEKEVNKKLDKEAQGYLEELAGDGSMNIRKIQELESELEKEKEKNKRYEKYLKSKDKQHEQVLEYLETEKENEYISKEKIKERIKEYYEYDKRMQNKPDWHTTKYYEAKALEKLLEE